MGFYLDPPSRRFAYDSDGTIGFTFPTNTNIITQLTQSDMQVYNDESVSATTVGGQFAPSRYVGFIFPEFRDITHIFVCASAGDFVVDFTSRFEYSVDTTNGLDGNWTASSNFVVAKEVSSTAFRDVDAYPMPNVKAVRLFVPAGSVVTSMNIGSIHLYGYKHAGETPHRIDFTDSAGAELLIDFDYGDQARNTERVWSPINTWNQATGLYLKNRSTSKAAYDVSLSFENLTGTMINDLALSEDGIVWTSFLNFDEIQPGEIVGPIYVKHELEITDPVGVRASRLKLDVEDWS